MCFWWFLWEVCWSCRKQWFLNVFVVGTDSPGNFRLNFSLKLLYKQPFIHILTQKTRWSLLKWHMWEEFSKWKVLGKFPALKKWSQKLDSGPVSLGFFLKVLILLSPLPPMTNLSRSCTSPAINAQPMVVTSVPPCTPALITEHLVTSTSWRSLMQYKNKSQYPLSFEVPNRA